MVSHLRKMSPFSREPAANARTRRPMSPLFPLFTGCLAPFGSWQCPISFRARVWAEAVSGPGVRSQPPDMATGARTCASRRTHRIRYRATLCLPASLAGRRPGRLGQSLHAPSSPTIRRCAPSSRHAANNRGGLRSHIGTGSLARRHIMKGEPHDHSDTSCSSRRPHLVRFLAACTATVSTDRRDNADRMADQFAGSIGSLSKSPGAIRSLDCGLQQIPYQPPPAGATIQTARAPMAQATNCRGSQPLTSMLAEEHKNSLIVSVGVVLPA